MNVENVLEQTTAYCDALRDWLQQQTATLTDFSRRLLQITQQLHKNIEVRDTQFAPQFNEYVQTLRKELDHQVESWTSLRAELRQLPEKSLTEDLALTTKGLNSRAKALGVTNEEFSSAYDTFCKYYKNFTAVKLHVFLLTSSQQDIAALTDKLLLLARELTHKIESNRSIYER